MRGLVRSLRHPFFLPAREVPETILPVHQDFYMQPWHSLRSRTQPADHECPIVREALEEALRHELSPTAFGSWATSEFFSWARVSLGEEQACSDLFPREQSGAAGTGGLHPPL